MFKHLKMFTIVVLLLTLAFPIVSSPAMAASHPVGVSAGNGITSSAIAAKSEADILAGRRKPWSGSTTYDLDSGKYKAVVTNGNTGDSYSWGSYDSKDEAQSAADGQADYNNKHGVVDAPGCNLPPFFLEC